MNIGIIGSGNMGCGLGSIWANKGHGVMFSYSRDRQKLELLAKSHTNASSGTPSEAVKYADIILLSVKWEVVEDAIRAAGPMDGKILIDCTNPLKPDLSDLALGHSTSAAEEIAGMAPGAKVVKAFNTVFAEVYHSENRLFGSRIPTMFFCGDDAEAKTAVIKLINDTGFLAVDSGPLTIARYLEPLAMLMIKLGYTQGMGTNIAMSLIWR